MASQRIRIDSGEGFGSLDPLAGKSEIQKPIQCGIDLLRGNSLPRRASGRKVSHGGLSRLHRSAQAAVIGHRQPQTLLRAAQTNFPFGQSFDRVGGRGGIAEETGFLPRDPHGGSVPLGDKTGVSTHAGQCAEGCVEKRTDKVGRLISLGVCPLRGGQPVALGADRCPRPQSTRQSGGGQASGQAGILRQSIPVGSQLGLGRGEHQMAATTSQFPAAQGLGHLSHQLLVPGACQKGG